MGKWQLWGSSSRPDPKPGTSKPPFDAQKLPQYLLLSQTSQLCRWEEIWVAGTIGGNGLQASGEVSLKFTSAVEFLLAS